VSVFNRRQLAILYRSKDYCLSSQKGDCLMRAVAVLHNSFPDRKSCIRKSRIYKHAAVIATDVNASRCMVVTKSTDPDQDYHLVHVLSCSPKELEMSWKGDDLELRPTHWYQLINVIRTFLDGGDIDALCNCV